MAAQHARKLLSADVISDSRYGEELGHVLVT
jgi:hypothetical protein